jgi:hypothetical protein
MVANKPFVANQLKGQPFQEVVIRRRNAAQRLIGELRTGKGRLRFNELLGAGLPHDKRQVCYGSPLVDVAATKELVEETIAIVQILLNDTSWDVRLLSKSPLLMDIAKSLSELQRDRVIFGLSTGTLDDRVARAIELRCPSVSKRLQALRWLQDNGFRTFGMLCPIFPQDASRFIGEAAEQIQLGRCEHIWAEVFNPRGAASDRTSAAFRRAGLGGWANRFDAVMCDDSAWEEYAREMFLALVPVIPRNSNGPKLRFLQYVTASSASWWRKQADNGAVLLGAAAHETEAVSEAGMPCSLSQLPPGKKAWVTMRNKYTPEEIHKRASEAGKKAWITMRSRGT